VQGIVKLRFQATQPRPARDHHRTTRPPHKPSQCMTNALPPSPTRTWSTCAKRSNRRQRKRQTRSCQVGAVVRGGCFVFGFGGMTAVASPGGLSAREAELALCGSVTHICTVTRPIEHQPQTKANQTPEPTPSCRPTLQPPPCSCLCHLQ